MKNNFVISYYYFYYPIGFICIKQNHNVKTICEMYRREEGTRENNCSNGSKCLDPVVGILRQLAEISREIQDIFKL